MRTLLVPTINGEQKEIVYAQNEIPYHVLAMSESVRKHKISYLNIPCAFDIESTTIKECERPYAFMYHWQMCLDTYVIFGRRWEEFILLIKTICEKLDLSNKRRLVIYIHNLPYEFQFLRNLPNITMSDVFLTKTRNTIRALMNQCIELRCSYKLSNMSLIKFCQNTPNVTHYKLVDTYDYTKIRTADTLLEEHEETYCFNDVYGLCECIRERLKEYNIAEIPMTSTGYIRNIYRNNMKQNTQNRKQFLDMALDSEQYEMCRRAMRGGDTHANLRWSMQIIHDVKSKDIESSYPASMMIDSFPTSKFFRISGNSIINGKVKGKCVIMQVAYESIEYIGIEGMPYISVSRCDTITRSRIEDNGRVLKADGLTLTCTDIDYGIIRFCYKYKKMYIIKAYVSEKGRMNEEFRNTLRELYMQKTQLKGIEEHYYEYMKKKNEVNGSYGMEVTDIAKPEIIYENHEYIEKIRDVADALKAYYSNRNSFLSYQQGVFVPANSRRRLREGIALCGRDTVYVDTDSVKYKNEHDFSTLNERLKKEADAAGATAYDKDGRKHYMGIWDDDGEYKRFKTMGAKKYIYESYDGTLHSTISGVDKTKGRKFFEIHGMEAFAEGTCINPSGHLSAYYNDDAAHYITVNGCTMLSAANVALVESDYTLNVTSEYLDIFKKTVDNIIEL